MSLLWHDGFGTYVTANSYFTQSYPLTSSSPVFDTRAAGRFAGTYALRFAQSGTNWFQTGDLHTYGPPGTDVCILGFAAKFTTHPTNGSGIVSLFSTSGFEQIRLVYRQYTASTYYFEVSRVSGGSVDKVLATSPIYSLNKWRFFELRIVFAQSTGVVEWRSNNVGERRVQNVRTEGAVGLNRGWSQIRFRNDGSTGTSITDIYVCNEDAAIAKPEHARFLGDNVSLAMFPDAGQQSRLCQWVFNPRALALGGGKKRLCVISGQSNANGQGMFASLPLNPGVQSPNPYIAVWWNNVFAALQAGVNNNNRFLPPAGNFEGPEMAFADLLADYFTQMSNVATPTGVAFIKAAQGSSSVYPNLPDYTWDPSTPGNLWNNLNGTAGARGALFQDIVAAVAALGGAGNIEQVDFYWYQGETDAIFSFSSIEYGFRLNALFDRIKSDLPGLKIKFHLVQLHKDLLLASGPDMLDGFWFRDRVRGYHQNIALLRNDTALIHVDDIPLAADQVHFDKNGYDKIGQRFFDSWVAAQPPAGEIDDLIDGPPDDDTTWLGVKATPVDFLVAMLGGRQRKGTRVRNVRFQATGKSDTSLLSAKVLVDAPPLQGASAAFTAFPGGAYGRRALNLDKNPATGKPWLEEQFEDHQFGLRSA